MMTELSLLMFWSSSGFRRSRGMATVMPCWRNGVTTMKIISSTSMMSTIGVTLISDARWSLPPCIPMTKTPSSTKPVQGAIYAPLDHISWYRDLRIQLLRAVLDEVVNQFRSRVVHFHDEAVDLAREVVEQPHRRNRHHQTERGSKERFRNTAGDRRDTG